MRVQKLALAVVLIGTVAAGCIGAVQDAPGDVVPTDDPDNVTALPATLGVVHTSVDGNATRLAMDAAGLSVPVGAAQLTGFPAFEPTIGVIQEGDSAGTLFMSNWGGTPGVDWTSVVRSTNQGANWTDITPSLGPASSPPQSNDPYVYVDPATGRLYNLDMQGLQCNWIQWSDDAGESWTQNPVGCGQPPLLDHPTIFAGPPNQVQTTGYENVVYLCVNRVADSACATSVDGGMTWTPFKTVYPGVDPMEVDPQPTDPFGTAFSGLCGGLHAHGVTGPDGTAYLPRGYCGTPMVAISEDDGLTWEPVTISEDVETMGHEVAFDVDSDGNAYAFWISPDRTPYLAVSPDGGWSWNDPVAVAPPSVGSASHPTIAAGDAGQVAMAYVGTDADVPYSAMGHEDTWNAYITATSDALNATPTLVTAPVNPPADPIARGECGGSRCFGDSGGALGDFIDVVIGPDGRPWAAFVDACTQGCANGTEATNDEGIGLVGTFASGPSLRGNATELPALDWTDV